MGIRRVCRPGRIENKDKGLGIEAYHSKIEQEIADFILEKIS